MIRFYGSPHCPDCMEAKRQLTERGITFSFTDITGSMTALKEFLRLRDQEAFFERVREKGLVGIPCFVLPDGRLSHDVRQALISEYLEEHRDEMVADIEELVRINSERMPAQEGKPFGDGPAEALAAGERILKKYGFEPGNCDNYAIDARLGKAEELGLDLLAHLDVVPGGDGWTVTTPFEPVLDNDTLYGRGTSDDKGPAMSALLAMRAVRDLGFTLKRDVRLILGSDEECGSSDIRYYFGKNEHAPLTISPDADFPVIFIEKGNLRTTFRAELEEDGRLPRVLSVDSGIKLNVVPAKADAVVEGLEASAAGQAAQEVQDKTGVIFTLEDMGEGKTHIHAEGKSAHASAPMDGNNALTALLELLSRLPLADTKAARLLREASRLFPHGDYYGSAVGAALEDEVSGRTTLTLDIFHMDAGEIRGTFDSRTCVSATDENTTAKVNASLAAAGFDNDGTHLNPPHYVPKDSPLVQTLLRVYTKVTGKREEPLAIGGGTYVHHIENGVACGCADPNIDNHMHGPDEFVLVSQLKKSAEIFALAILELCGK